MSGFLNRILYQYYPSHQKEESKLNTEKRTDFEQIFKREFSVDELQRSNRNYFFGNLMGASKLLSICCEHIPNKQDLKDVNIQDAMEFIIESFSILNSKESIEITDESSTRWAIHLLVSLLAIYEEISWNQLNAINKKHNVSFK
jgi:hypothetical protein